MEISDTALLQRWQQSSDSEAFAEIVGRHSSMVFATCNRILRNPSDAEDVTQECFMELGGVRRLIGDSLGGFLHTLATHRSLDRLKGESRRREREIRYAMGRPTSCAIGWDDIYPHIDEAIANLPMKYRDAVIRHFLEGQTQTEIARILGIADSTVRYRIQKGIERVRVDLRHRGVIVSASAMGTALSGSRAETISATLSANLGKLSVAGTSKATRATTVFARAERTVVLKKVLGIAVIAGLAGLLLWGLDRESTPPEPKPIQANEAPPVDSPEEEQPDGTVADAAGDTPVEPEPVTVAAAEANEMDTVEEVDVVEHVEQVAAVEEVDIAKEVDIAEEEMVDESKATPVDSLAPEKGGNAAPPPPIEVRPEEPETENAPFTVAMDMEPIRIELPEAFFGGTPLDYWGPNLEEIDYRDRAPFLAPIGATIVSRGRPVTASSEPTMGALRQLTDGDKDYAKTSLVELPEGLQWVQVDLESSKAIYAVLVWHFHEGNRVYFDLVAQLSDDPDFKEGVTTIYNNDYDNSAGLGVGEDKEYVESNKGRLIDAKGASGRYVRVYGKGNSDNDFTHFIEIEVWGK